MNAPPSGRPLSLGMVMLLFFATAGSAGDGGAQVAVLSESNYERFVPDGKEVDAVNGDYVLRNERIVAIIGNPIAGRDANMTARGVGGAVIDLTSRRGSQDLLTAFYPGGRDFVWQQPRIQKGADGAVSLTLRSIPRDNGLEATLTYTLGGDASYLTITMLVSNATDRPMDAVLRDLLRCDGPSFTRVPDGPAPVVWAADPWFGQAYGLRSKTHAAVVRTRGDRTTIRWGRAGGEDSFTLEPGESVTVILNLFPADHEIGAKGMAHAFEGEPVHQVTASVTDLSGAPVPRAAVTLKRQGEMFGRARSSEEGVVAMPLPAGNYSMTVEAPGFGSKTLEFAVAAGMALDVKLGKGMKVVGHIVDNAGTPVPCKVMFVGVDGTSSPEFGPKVGVERVGNLIYTTDGRFSAGLDPGTYEVTASRGPEYDAVTRRIKVGGGPREIPFEAVLNRSVPTPGWVSADFHGHSTASGDTSASKEGRVLNLAAEGVEFAPCTEHNRIDTYAPEIRRMHLEPFLATSSGIELTGHPFALNHQNAFPLHRHPHLQGNGAPRIDPNPAVQVKRLADWDDGSEKLVQQNHPDIGWLFFDRTGDGYADQGFPGVRESLDVMEVWSVSILRMQPLVMSSYEVDGEPVTAQVNNRFFNWLQLLNQGTRIPGTANTDAHTNFHGSGGIRNYVRSSTDDPLSIDPLDIVRQAEKGHIVMTNGPYLEVSLEPIPANGVVAIPGDAVTAHSGRVQVHVKVQCPNWFDIDRVHILLNGAFTDPLTFVRSEQPERFGQGPVKFDQRLELDLKRDTHIIVLTGHTKKLLFPIMGPVWGNEPPVAISNPIFVDVDGGGFKPSLDTLGHPLPVKKDRGF